VRAPREKFLWGCSTPREDLVVTRAREDLGRAPIEFARRLRPVQLSLHALFDNRVPVLRGERTVRAGASLVGTLHDPEQKSMTLQLTRTILEVCDRAGTVTLASEGGVDKKFAPDQVQVVVAGHFECGDGDRVTGVAVTVELVMHRRAAIECARSPLKGLPASATAVVARELAPLEYAKPRVELVVVPRVNARELHVRSQ